MKLQEKWVLITGASRRIGREIALHFAERGANILLHDHHFGKEAKKLSVEIHRKKVACRIYTADFLKTANILKLTARILKDVGCVDVLINNASLFYPTQFEKIRERDWDVFLGIHVKAPFFLTQALAPAMKKKGQGRVIHIADWSGLRPYKDYLPYCVSKGALITMTQALAKTLAPEVLVTAICPGPILPPRGMDTAKRETIAKKTLVGRWGNPMDIARMAVFLAEQDFVTGSAHLVDGGEFLRG